MSSCDKDTILNLKKSLLNEAICGWPMEVLFGHIDIQFYRFLDG